MNRQIKAHHCGICGSPLKGKVKGKSIKKHKKRTKDRPSDPLPECKNTLTMKPKTDVDGTEECKSGEEQDSSETDKRMTRLSTGTIEPHRHDELDLEDDPDNESIDVPFDAVMESQNSSSDEEQKETTTAALKVRIKKKAPKRSSSQSILRESLTENKLKKKRDREIDLTQEQLEMRRSLDPKLLEMLDIDEEVRSKELKCKECKATFRQLSCFMKHTKTHTGVDLDMAKPYVCQFCNHSLSNLTMFERHMSRHRNQKAFICEWDGCHAKFACKRYLTKHVRRHEGHTSYTKLYVSNSQPKERKFPCSFENCTYVGITKHGLKVHENRHTNARPYKCHYCDSRFNDPSGQRNHEANKHSDSKDSHFMCELCGYSSYYKSDLIKHQRIHSGVKPFACNQCDYRCNRRDNLKKHLRIHTGDKKYKCFHCESVFPTLKSCKIHEKTHSAFQSQPTTTSRDQTLQTTRGSDKTDRSYAPDDESHFKRNDANKILPINNDDSPSIDTAHSGQTSETMEMKPYPVSCNYSSTGQQELGEISQQGPSSQSSSSQSEDWIRAVSLLQHLHQM